jgi:hypothetical protein
VYAAVIAFGVVALSSLGVDSQSSATSSPSSAPSSKPSTTTSSSQPPAPSLKKITIIVSAANPQANPQLLTNLTVKVRDVSEKPVDAQGRWSADVPPGEHEVCVVSSTAPVRLAGSSPGSACQGEQMSTDREIKLAVEPVQVVGIADTKDKQVPVGSKVTVYYKDREPQYGALDAAGRFTPSNPLLNAAVCLNLPDGWRFAGLKETSQRCQSVTDPPADVLFHLEKS